MFILGSSESSWATSYFLMNFFSLGAFVLSQFTRLTDGQMLIRKTALHTMQRGKNGSLGLVSVLKVDHLGLVSVLWLNVLCTTVLSNTEITAYISVLVAWLQLRMVHNFTHLYCRWTRINKRFSWAWWWRLQLCNTITNVYICKNNACQKTVITNAIHNNRSEVYHAEVQCRKPN